MHDFFAGGHNNGVTKRIWKWLAAIGLVVVLLLAAVAIVDTLQSQTHFTVRC